VDEVEVGIVVGTTRAAVNNDSLAEVVTLEESEEKDIAIAD